MTPLVFWISRNNDRHHRLNKGRRSLAGKACQTPIPPSSRSPLADFDGLGFVLKFVA